jgi:hypothetical protein
MKDGPPESSIPTVSPSWYCQLKNPLMVSLVLPTSWTDSSNC